MDALRDSVRALKTWVWLSIMRRKLEKEWVEPAWSDGVCREEFLGPLILPREQGTTFLEASGGIGMQMCLPPLTHLPVFTRSPR